MLEKSYEFFGVWGILAVGVLIGYIVRFAHEKRIAKKKSGKLQGPDGKA